MINRLIALLVLLPIAVVLIALAVANRGPANFTIDPFNPGNPALTLEMPLFVWLFAAIAVGMIIGSVATWFSQAHYRKEAREQKKKVNALRQEQARKNSTSATGALQPLGK